MEELVWRFWSCPRTLEGAALDFLEIRNPQRAIQAVLADLDPSYNIASFIDFKRRIAHIYGLSGNYNINTTGRWSAGWNRRLLAAAGPEPEEAAERILHRVCELAKAGRATSRKEAPGGPDNPSI